VNPCAGEDFSLDRRGIIAKVVIEERRFVIATELQTELNVCFEKYTIYLRYSNE
jgi:hypothetical protein